MTGLVDDHLRALLRVPVSASFDGERTEILAWIDTAFSGGLAVPQSMAIDLKLVEQSYAPAILADGSTVDLPTYSCFVDWFGKRYETQVAAGEARFPLLGTIFLAEHRLIVDYAAKSVELQ